MKESESPIWREGFGGSGFSVSSTPQGSDEKGPGGVGTVGYRVEDVQEDYDAGSAPLGA